VIAGVGNETPVGGVKLWGRSVGSGGIVGRRRSVLSRSASQDEDLMSEAGVDIPEITDEEAERTWMADAVCLWLDDEYIPQQCHRDIGDSTASFYCSLRNEDGVNDLSSIVLAVGSHLESQPEIFDDAFVGPFDIANKLSELLLRRMGREICDCDMTPEELRAVRIAGHVRAVREANEDAFLRYKFVRELLEPTVDDDLVNVALWIAMGYKYESDEASGAGVWLPPEPSASSPGSSSRPREMSDDNVTPVDYVRGVEWTRALEAELVAAAEEDSEEEERLTESLEDFIETMVGEELLKVRRSSVDNDQWFGARAVAVKWLHLFGES